jgi:hypothetical protein
MRLTKPEITIQCTKQVLEKFIAYVHNCINELTYWVEPKREPLNLLLLHNMQALCEKCYNRFYKDFTSPANKNCKVKITHGERISLSILFKRYPVYAELQLI